MVNERAGRAHANPPSKDQLNFSLELFFHRARGDGAQEHGGGGQEQGARFDAQFHTQMQQLADHSEQQNQKAEDPAGLGDYAID